MIITDNTLALALHAAIAAVAPIDGVSIGDPDKRDTWRIDFRREATDQERAAAAELLVSFTPTEPVPLISKRQALIFLLQLGKTEADVEAAIDTMPDELERETARIEWRYPSAPLRHDKPLCIALAQQIGIAVEDLPAAFRAAAQL